MKKQILISIILLSSCIGFSQSGNWRLISPQNEFFSFRFPDLPEYSNETENTQDYKYTANDVIMMCNLVKYNQPFIYYLNLEAQEDSITYNPGDSMTNPLIAITEFFKYCFDETQIQSIQDLNTGNANVTGREISMVYSNDLNPPQLMAIRVYYNGHDLLTFSVETPLTNISQFNTNKNLYFSSITIN